MIVNVAIFVSGNGSNCEEIIKYFNNSKTVKIALVLSSKQDAYALVRAKKYNVPTVVVNKNNFNSKDYLLNILHGFHIDFIVLAGFLLMVPEFLINIYPSKIINLHPALLPKFGGKGMYGHHVHEAVKNAGEEISGFTVHFVSTVCDGGEIIKQHSFKIERDDSASDIAEKEHLLELEYFPCIIESVINSIFKDNYTND